MAQTKNRELLPGFFCLDTHELLFLGGEFLFGDDAGIEEILVLPDLGDGIGGGGRSGRSSRNSRGEKAGKVGAADGERSSPEPPGGRRPAARIPGLPRGVRGQA